MCLLLLCFALCCMRRMLMVRMLFLLFCWIVIVLLFRVLLREWELPFLLRTLNSIAATSVWSNDCRADLLQSVVWWCLPSASMRLPSWQWFFLFWRIGLAEEQNSWMGSTLALCSSFSAVVCYRIVLSGRLASAGVAALWLHLFVFLLIMETHNALGYNSFPAGLWTVLVSVSCILHCKIYLCYSLYKSDFYQIKI